MKNLEYPELIDCKAKCTYITFNKDSFTIAKFKTEDKDSPTYFTLKGDFIVQPYQEYTIKAKNSNDKKWPDTYIALAVTQFQDLLKSTKTEQKSFLKMILSESDIKALYEVSDNPIQMLEDRDLEGLMEAKGIGLKKAEKLISAYDGQKDYSSAYIAFVEYSLNPTQVKKICAHFKGIDKAIAAFQKDPYVLTQLNGYGFKRADSVFLSNPKNKPNDNRRVKAYIKYIFDENASEGHSWMSAKDFAFRIKSEIHGADLKFAIDYVKEDKGYAVYRLDGELRITTKQILNTELEICKHINRIMNAKNKHLQTVMDNLDVIKKVQIEQGWKFDEDQQKAIKSMISKNVFLLQGLSGSGKSSSLNAYISVLKQAGLTYNQCRLSGKAANNIFLITGEKATTIHSMLVYNPKDDGFVFNEKNPLPANVVIIDEGSMVDMFLFLDVIKSIKTGSQLIILGDMAQLESIGIGIMGGLIKSGKFPEQLLTKIHRQAQKSAIITHSIAVRRGAKPTELKFDTGANTYGELEDLEYVFVENSEEDKIALHVMNRFRELYSKHDVNDIQIICSTKSTGKTSTWDLNKFAQRIRMNNEDLTGEYFTIKRKGYKKPKDDEKITLNKNGNDDNSEYLIHVGEKVINMRNNKHTNDTMGESCPIYNGNTGIVKRLMYEDGEEDSLLIDFEGVGEVIVPNHHLEFIELGYSITCHKSQGSTIPYVIFALPFHYLLNTRELLYTGMTRSSKHLTLITSPRSFKSAVKKTDVKDKRSNFADLFTRREDFDFADQL